MTTGRWSAAFVMMLAFLAPGSGVSQPRNIEISNFQALAGWQQDSHASALAVFMAGCGSVRSNALAPAADWVLPCAAARGVADGDFAARLFFESWFQPVMLTDGQPAQFTAYFEPELPGSRQRSDRFRYPLYAPPPELRAGGMWHTRAEIETQGLLAGRGLELVWLEDPVEAFYVHVQGSARIRLQDGTLVRLGFAGRNGHQFRSAARELIRRGKISANLATPDGLRQWVLANPDQGRSALQINPSYIFFRELNLAENSGPVGALQLPLTPMRSIAVDPRHVPLGAPVWLEMESGAQQVHSLMVAQDTGDDIRGAQRADVFFGTGRDIGLVAGRSRFGGRAFVLLPHAAIARLRGQVGG